jgi:predicted TPR repeat methyltransferase
MSHSQKLEAVQGHPAAAFMREALERGQVPERTPDAEVKASFDAYAADFDKHIRSLDYRAPELVAEVLARRLPAADARLDVLDGGCGTGLSAPLLRPYARQLTGVDLSSAMLDRARKTGFYDTLVESELGSFLASQPESFDVCVLVDVLVYFGDLHIILASAAQSLRADGLLAFSLEKSDRPGSHLQPTGRYSQHADHVQAALVAAGFVAIEQTDANVRTEGNAPVAGLIVSARRPGSSAMR